MTRTLRCGRHPKYQAKRPPRVVCFDCKILWVFRQRYGALIRPRPVLEMTDKMASTGWRKEEQMAATATKSKRVTELVNPLGKQKVTKPEDVGPVNLIAIVADTSGSMGGLRDKLVDLLNEQIDGIKKAAHEAGQKTRLMVLGFQDHPQGTFGTRTSPVVLRELVVPEAVDRFDRNEIKCDTHGTPLMDTVYEATRHLEEAKIRHEEKHGRGSDISCLVIVLTDGMENASRQVSRNDFARNVIVARQATDRWTFAFLVPPGNEGEITALGVPGGNVQPWEATEKGLKRAGEVVTRGVGGYIAARAGGQTMTASFFPDMSNVTKRDLKKLEDVSGEFGRYYVDREQDISSYCTRHLGGYELGRAYYELTKAERIQSHKDIVIEDRRDAKLYGGAKARELLGIKQGPGVTVSVKPGNHTGFKIFVKSTSMNRKLVRGTELLYRR